MSHNQWSGAQYPTSSKSGSSDMSKSLPETSWDDWSDIKDPVARRKIQNRLAQRRFRDKIKEQKEDAEREAENQKRAAGSYVSPEPESFKPDQTLSGLPWGGISMRYIVEQGRRRDQIYRQSSYLNTGYEGLFYTGTGSNR
ncbi:bZIP-1 domain containing protein [Pyrenophora tritici-repentis]|nr:hypothetical protein PtrV1_04345 [Pyrenophora tritici-repentis]KAF7452030.1 hypothetical protein A1F99_038070 [Pyrenophora tritici-repentis]KAG9386385.1 hypothetical protein A1F94_003135 [Pyrenophora tritici-repentis]KAI1518910.1 hypothetical protein Ptr86124_002038 [Pyrenophora tritici-repentis]KAI1549728.1 bZIP-1 domain containing protein [Pyrenophora tritici-repentis]